uniref:Uncharacterized protein n=1 Tax=Anguilla anguilla TaxID=7936 RepID=A0A0E9V5J1_ANGAN
MCSRSTATVCAAVRRAMLCLEVNLRTRLWLGGLVGWTLLAIVYGLVPRWGTAVTTLSDVTRKLPGWLQ